MDQQPILDTETDCMPPSRAADLQKVDASAVVPGMWIAEVDRPWLDTPFPMQGFLLREHEELYLLRDCCKFVWIDRKRSVPGALAGLPEVESEKQGGATGSSAHRLARAVHALSAPKLVRSSDRPSPTNPADDVPHGWRRWIEQLRGWFRSARIDGSLPKRLSLHDALLRPPASEPRAILRELLPGVSPVVWPQRKTIHETLPQARAIFTKGTEVLQRMLVDIQRGQLPGVEELNKAVDEMVDCMVDNADALLWVARLRDQAPDRYIHGVNVAVYLVALGRHLGLPKLQLAQLGTIGMVADIGMMNVPTKIIQKPGMLTAEEFEVVKRHVQSSIDALDKAKFLTPEAREGILQHHERLDGSGYPYGLAGGQIGFWGRITAIADCYAALVRPRPYAQALAPQDALMTLYQHGQHGLHGPLVEQFVQAVGAFPVGSLVELSSGEVAAVLSHNRVRRLEPRVLVLTDARKKALPHPVQRELLQPRVAEDARVRIARGLPAKAYGLRLEDYYLTSSPALHDARLHRMQS